MSLENLREEQFCKLKENNNQFEQYVKYIGVTNDNIQIWQYDKKELLYIFENNKHKIFKIMRYAITSTPWAIFKDVPMFEFDTIEELIKQLETIGFFFKETK